MVLPIPCCGGGNSLLVTYIGDDKDQKFGITADGCKIATENLKGSATGNLLQNLSIAGRINGT